MALDKSLYNKNDLFILDNLKGIAILLVFLHHCSLTHSLTLAFLTIIMPIFAFATGYGLKQVKNFTPMYKNLILLLVIYILMGFLLVGFFYCFIDNFNRNDCINVIARYMVPIWYMFGIVIWTALLGLVNDFKYTLALSLLFSIGFMIVFKSYTVVPFLSTMIRYIALFFPFFILGTIIEWQTILKIRKSKFKYLLIPIFLISMYLYATKNLIYPPKAIKDILAYIILSFPSILFIIAFLSGRKIKFLTKIGQRSMNIYVLHNAIAKSILPIASSFCIDTSSYLLRFIIIPLLFLIISIFITSDIFTKYFNILLSRIKSLIFKNC